MCTTRRGYRFVETATRSGAAVKKEARRTTADFENKHTSTIWFLLKEGTVNKVSGFEQIAKDPAVFHISKRLNEGDVVDSKMIGTESQVLARVYLKCETRKELEVKIKEIYNTVKVFDLNSNNQLLNNFNIN